jgi:hypothetical protein
MSFGQKTRPCPGSVQQFSRSRKLSALYDREVKLNQQQHRKNSSKTQIPAYLLMILAMAERGGLYRSFYRNSPVFCHFIHKTRIFCRLRSGLRSFIRLSSALPSLLWTSKVPKKSNMSNKPGFPSCATLGLPFGDGFRHMLFAGYTRPR